jgi:DNA/RNA endonuclease G (NUC1)
VTTVKNVPTLKSETKYLIDRNILNLNGIPDEKIVIQQDVTNSIGNGVVYGEAVMSNLLQTIPSISAIQQLMGFKDNIVNGDKDLVLVDKEVIAKGGDEIIPIPNPNRGLIGFSVLAIVLAIITTATNEVVNSEVNLTISTFPEDEGLRIKDEGFVKRPSQAPDTALYTDRNGTKDYNYNRVFTLTWKLVNYAANLGQWYIGGQLLTPDLLPGTEIAIDALNLTAGQKYYWQGEYVSANTGIRGRIQGGEFTIPQHQPKTDPEKTFSSVTVITPDAKTNFGDLSGREKAIELAKGIALNFDGEGDNGTILVYDSTNNNWTAPIAEFSSLTNLTPNKFGAPLILIDDWGLTSGYQSNGFAEASADNFFAALVSLNQSFSGDKQNALFDSPLHFIGHGRGAVVNSEVIQRLGTYFPHAGGVYRDADGKVLRGDLQMTTIDPYDYSTLGDYLDPKVQVWDNVTFADNYYQTTSIDRYRGGAVGNTIPDGWLPDGSPTLSRADVNVNLSGRSGFTIEDLNNGKDPHNNTFAWYTGTANVNLDGSASTFGTPILRRKGDFSQDVFYDGTTYKPWYTKDLEPINGTSTTLQSVALGDSDAQWEGVGTGWYYSAIGGGYWRRNQLIGGNAPNPRTPIGYDNTVTKVQRGDFAVPTLFDGNFDAVKTKKATDPIPGWMLEGTDQPLLQYALVTRSPNTPNQNYALRLSSTQNITSVIHNPFIIPDWGNLSLDLYVPELGNFNTIDPPKLKVSIEGIGENQWQPLTMLWGYRNSNNYNNVAVNNLQDINLISGEYGYSFKQLSSASYTLTKDPELSKVNRFDDRDSSGNQIDRFETFTLAGAALEALRGKTARLKLELEGSATVIVDNIFFQSPHLRLGNPSDARKDINNSTNYLVERPQYSLSYNSEKKNPNWVSWILDNTWHQPTPNNGYGWNRPKIEDLPKPGDISNPQYAFISDRYPFELDYAFPSTWQGGVDSYFNTTINDLIYDRGHVVASDDRNITRKDQYATYLMSNFLPMARATNGFDKIDGILYQGAWYGLERYLSGLAESGKKLYITAGGIGKIGLTTGGVDVPEKLWKVAVVLESNQDISEINENNDIIAVILPNDDSLDKTVNGDRWAKDGTQDGIGRVKISQIEALIGQTLPGFDLLSNIKKTVLKQNLKDKVYANPYLSSPLQADLDDSQQSSTTFIRDNSTITPNSILEQSSTIVPKTAHRIEEVGILEERAANIGSIDISPFQVSSGKITTYPGISKIAIGQIGIGKVGIGEVSTNKNSSSKITSSQIGFFRQPDLGKISLPSSISFEQFFNRNIWSKEKASEFMPSGSEDIFSTPRPLTLNPESQSTFVFGGIDVNPIHNNVSNLLTNIYSSAQSLWQTTTPIDLNFAITNLPTGQLAEGTITSYNTNGTPKTATITIDTDANGVGWFIDLTPQDHSEFGTGTGTYLIAEPNSAASGKYDLLTTILHEMGHTLGIINGYSEFNKYVKGKKFITDTITAHLTPDGSHLDPTFHPYDLMNTSLKTGVRKLPSAMDWAMIDTLWNNE